MSKLSETAVYPKPIERQRVSILVSKFFVKKPQQYWNLNYGRQHCIDITGTVTSIRKVLKWWTIINVKNKGQPLQTVISHPNDPRLQFVEKFGEMCLNMSGRQGTRKATL